MDELWRNKWPQRWENQIIPKHNAIIGKPRSRKNSRIKKPSSVLEPSYAIARKSQSREWRNTAKEYLNIAAVPSPTRTLI
jgi:hypothetical protein